MRILVTGSRTISVRDQESISRVFDLLGYSLPQIVVGDCPTGVDRLAREKFLEAEVHRADWDTHGRAAGPIRNQAMVDSGADLCLAFPSSRRVRGRTGTGDCMRRAKEAGIPVLVMELEGA